MKPFSLSIQINFVNNLRCIFPIQTFVFKICQISSKSRKHIEDNYKEREREKNSNTREGWILAVSVIRDNDLCKYSSTLASSRPLIMIKEKGNATYSVMMIKLLLNQINVVPKAKPRLFFQVNALIKHKHMGADGKYQQLLITTPCMPHAKH